MAAAASTWEGLELAGGRYRVTSRLVGGGMADVYRAWDKNLQTDVIIKVPLQELLRNATFTARFSREVRTLVRFAHPHIVKVLDVGEHAGVPFAVMQHLAGGSLRNRQIGPKGDVQPLASDHLKGWLAGIAEALDFIHGQNYVHRDVKPGNILFDQHGNAYLSDFGVIKAISSEGLEEVSANLTQRGMVLGTLQYMPPEIFRGQKYDGRADQYALGVTVYELLSGRWPFKGNNPAAVMMEQMKTRPTALHEIQAGVPVGVSQAVARALAKEPADRFADCKAMARTVLEALCFPGAPVALPFASAPPRTPEPAAPIFPPLLGSRRSNLPARCVREVVTIHAEGGAALICPACQADLGLSPDQRRLTVMGKANRPAPAIPAALQEPPAPLTFGLPDNTEAVRGPMTFGINIEDPPPSGLSATYKLEVVPPPALPPGGAPAPIIWDEAPPPPSNGWKVFLLVTICLLLLAALAACTFFAISFLKKNADDGPGRARVELHFTRCLSRLG